MAYSESQLIPFFQWVFRTTMQASVLVCLILAVQALLRGKLGARWHYCLWLLLLVRLVMPGAPESGLSVFNLMPFGQGRHAGVTREVVVLPRTAPAEPVLISVPEPMGLLPGQLDGQPIGAQRAPFRAQAVPLIWVLGALIIAVYAMSQNIALSSRINRQRQVTDENVLGLLEDCKTTMGVRAYLSVVETLRAKSPALLGFIRPRLLLPEGMVETLDRDELRYVFLHEVAHLKRHDIAVNWLMAVLQLMHWFNPLIWYAFYRMRADREIACDALVLSRARPGESQSYGRTIVNLLERFSEARRVPGLAGIVEQQSQIKRRITMIALFKRDSLLRSVVSLVLLAALGCVVLTDARGAPEGGAGKGGDIVLVADVEQTTVESEVVDGRIVDKIDYPFVDHPEAVGTWKSVDFVKEIEDFKSGEKKWEGDLYLKEMVIVEDGKTARPWWTWTRGLIFHSGDRTASRYVIKEMDGETYMFFEWKSGDYTIRHRKPAYYVLRKVSSEVRERDRAWARAATTDPDFRREVNAKIPQLDIDNATLDDVIALFGEPLVYVWGNETFEKESLPHRYILSYPDHFDIYMRGDQIVELRYYNPGYTFKESIEVGAPLELVLEVLGDPEKTVEGQKNMFEDGVLYKDIDGRKGYCYYARNDQDVRVWFMDCKVHAIYVTRSDYGERRPPTKPLAKPEPEVKKYLDVGVKLYADGYYRDALERFQRVLALDPDNEIAQKYARECAQYLTPGGVEDVTVEYPRTRIRPLARADPEPEEEKSAIPEMRKIEEKLQKARVTLDYAKGTDIRDVLSVLAESVGVNIVLDERVMVDSTLEFPDELRVEPTIEPGIGEVHLEDTPADEVLKAILEPMGLDYGVQPEFIWVSTPDVLAHECFVPLETRYYLMQNADRADQMMAKLQEAVPDIIEPYTGRPLSYMDFSATTKLLIIHNTPSNLETVEEMLEELDRD